MTAEDFLDLLPIVAHRGWSVGWAGLIRDRDGVCPLCALVKEIEPSSRYWSDYQNALALIGVGYSRGAIDVASAADDVIVASPLRARLLRALGLPPQTRNPAP